MVAKTAKLSMPLQGVSRLRIANSKGVRPLYSYRVSEIPTIKSSARPHPYDQSYFGALTDYLLDVEAADELQGATESPRNQRFYGKKESKGVERIGGSLGFFSGWLRSDI